MPFFFAGTVATNPKMSVFTISANQVSFMRKRISVSDLRLGMYIEEFCGSWMDHPFWCARFVVDNEVDLRKIQSSAIAEVWINADFGLDVESTASARPLGVEAESRTAKRLQKAVADLVP